MATHSTLGYSPTARRETASLIAGIDRGQPPAKSDPGEAPARNNCSDAFGRDLHLDGPVDPKHICNS